MTLLVKRYSKKSRNQLSKLNLVLASLKYTVPSEASIAASANLNTTNGGSGFAVAVTDLHGAKVTKNPHDLAVQRHLSHHCSLERRLGPLDERRERRDDPPRQAPARDQRRVFSTQILHPIRYMQPFKLGT
uniref:Uncharacterized protein n=1 Tax=Oryza rufipogon TaxID=4529 RepID=A0A0E0QB70_ORYRU